MTISHVNFFVSGIPKATQTGSCVRLKSGRAIPLRRNTAWSTLCGLVARDHAPSVPLSGPLVAELEFRFVRPASARKREYPIVRPDLDNCIKGLLDSFCGVLYEDDSQIVDLIVRKRYTDTSPGLFVEIRGLIPAQHREAK